MSSTSTPRPAAAIAAGTLLAGVVGCSAPLSPPPAGPEAPPAGAALEQELGRVMSELQHAWQRRDFDAYLAHFAEDADLVNRVGRWFRGKRAIAEQLAWLGQRGYPEMFSESCSVEQVRSLAPGVALLHERRFAGTRLASRAVYVLARRSERWLVQSLSIAPLEAAAPRPVP